MFREGRPLEESPIEGIAVGTPPVGRFVGRFRDDSTIEEKLTGGSNVCTPIVD